MSLRRRCRLRPSPAGPGGARGQSTVEFALVLIPFLLLLLGIFDLGRAVFYQHMLSNAARVGARAGAVATRTENEICARAVAAVRLPDVPAGTGCGAIGSLTAAAERGTPESPTQPVRVTLRYTFRPVTPMVSRALGGQIVLAASSTMYVEA